MSERCSCGGPLPCPQLDAIKSASWGPNLLSSPASGTKPAAGTPDSPDATIARLRGVLVMQTAATTKGLEAIALLTAERDEALATIERVQSLLGDTAGPLWSVRGVCEANLQAALIRRSE